MASNQAANTNTNTTTATNTNLTTHHEIRAYRKGNWTISETMVLIEAKKMDDERRMKRNIIDHNSIESSNAAAAIINMRSKPTELRWKWVEDYCCRKGCLRSQNQCNDKWDNLMRDYKKVREHERRVAAATATATAAANDAGGGEVEEVITYWRMEKAERKDKSLPANMLPHVYQALVDVVENRKGSSSSSSTLLLSPSSSSLVGQQSMVINSSGVNVGGGLTANMNPNIDYHSFPYPHNQPQQQQQHHHVVMSSHGSVQQHHISAPVPPMLLPLPTTSRPPILQQTPSPPPPPPQQLPVQLPPQPQPPPHSQLLPTVDSSDTSEHSDSPAKRRRRTSGGEAGTSSEPPHATGSGGCGGGDDGGGGGGSTFREVGNAITKSASMIAKALRSREEKEDKRHKDLVSLHERRLKIEESKSEINRQGINGLVDAINKLANSILALASNNKNQ